MNNETLKYDDSFNSYVCTGDTIEATRGEYRLVAKVVMDEITHIDDDDVHNVDETTSDEQREEIERIRTAWVRGYWYYIGIEITSYYKNIELGDVNALWGLECNYPQEDGTTDDSYLTAVAEELLEEAYNEAEKRREMLIEKLTNADG